MQKFHATMAVVFSSLALAMWSVAVILMPADRVRADDGLPISTATTTAGLGQCLYGVGGGCNNDCGIDPRTGKCFVGPQACVPPKFGCYNCICQPAVFTACNCNKPPPPP